MSENLKKSINLYISERMFQKKINPNEKILEKLKKVDKKWVIVVDSGQKRMYNEPTLRIGEIKTRRGGNA